MDLHDEGGGEGLIAILQRLYKVVVKMRRKVVVTKTYLLSSTITPEGQSILCLIMM